VRCLDWQAPGSIARRRRRVLKELALMRLIDACHAGPSPPTPSASGSTRWLTISAILCGAGDAEDGGAVVADQLREKLIKIGVKVVSQGRYATFQSRGRGAATDAPGTPDVDRATAGATRTSVTER
jgi:hypothetical protein